jgi:hypothetical protein
VHYAAYERLFSNMQLIEQAGRTPICLPWRTFDERIEAYTNCSIAILTDREMSRKLERKEVKNMEEKKAKKGTLPR